MLHDPSAFHDLPEDDVDLVSDHLQQGVERRAAAAGGPVWWDGRPPFRASPAAALFYVGGILVGAPLKGRLTSMSVVSIAKLVIHPLLVAFIVWQMPGLSTELRIAAVIFASSPMLAIYPIIGYI